VTFNFTRTREQVAQLVLGKIQQVQPTAVVSTDMETVYEAVDLRLKEMHVLGIYWRKVAKTPLSFAVTNNVKSASATVDVLFPISMVLVDGDRDSAVKIISAREYASITDKEATGVPTTAVWKGSAEFIFHPVPITDTTARLTYEKIADDTAAATAPDVDVAVLRSLCDLVKYDLVDQFGVPEDKANRWSKEAAMAEKRIRKLSVERVDTTTVAVDELENRRDRGEGNGYVSNDYVL
jgi:hypothetical protein